MDHKTYILVSLKIDAYIGSSSAQVCSYVPRCPIFHCKIQCFHNTKEPPFPWEYDSGMRTF